MQRERALRAGTGRTAVRNVTTKAATRQPRSSGHAVAGSSKKGMHAVCAFLHTHGVLNRAEPCPSVDVADRE